MHAPVVEQVVQGGGGAVTELLLLGDVPIGSLASCPGRADLLALDATSDPVTSPQSLQGSKVNP